MSDLQIPILDANAMPIAEITIRELDGRHFIERTKFINSFCHEVDEATMIKLRELALNKNWNALNSLDPEFLPWYCTKCEQNYAENKWRVYPVYEDDDHWLDSYRGSCPKGHNRMMAD